MTTVQETFETPSSSNIASVAYDPETETMTVEFRSGDTYDYFNVPVRAYQSFTQAGSAGQYFIRNIKSRYACEQT